MVKGRGVDRTIEVTGVIDIPGAGEGHIVRLLAATGPSVMAAEVGVGAQFPAAEVLTEEVACGNVGLPPPKAILDFSKALKFFNKITITRKIS